MKMRLIPTPNKTKILRVMLGKMANPRPPRFPRFRIGQPMPKYQLKEPLFDFHKKKLAKQKVEIKKIPHGFHKPQIKKGKKSSQWKAWKGFIPDKQYSPIKKIKKDLTGK